MSLSIFILLLLLFYRGSYEDYPNPNSFFTRSLKADVLSIFLNLINNRLVELFVMKIF